MAFSTVHRQLVQKEQVLSNMQAHAHLLVRLGTHHHLRLFNVAMEFFPRMILFVDPQPAVPPLELATKQPQHALKDPQLIRGDPAQFNVQLVTSLTLLL